MADKKYKIDRLIANAMHFPAIGTKESPLFLYTKVPEYKGTTDNFDDKYSTDKNYSSWLKEKERIYGSPKNIIKVFIHARGVETMGLTSPVGSTHATVSRKYWVDIRESEIYGDPLRALSLPLVCSNIEEVYIDIEVLDRAFKNSPYAIERLKMEKCNIGGIWGTLLGGNKTGALAQSDIPYKMFLSANGKSSFKRLRTVAIVKDLFVGREDKFLTRGIGSRSYEEHANEIKETGASMVVSNIEENNSTYGVISTAPNIYKFDRDVLDSKAKEFAASFAKVIEESKKATTAESEVEAESKAEEESALNQFLNELLTKYGDNGAKIIVRSALSTMESSERTHVTNRINKEIASKIGLQAGGTKG